MRIWLPMARDRGQPLVEIEIGLGDRAEYEAAGRTAARMLFTAFPRMRDRREPGHAVVVRMDAGDFSRELHEAAVAAFEAEWAQLVPGWEAPPKQDQEEG